MKYFPGGQLHSFGTTKTAINIFVNKIQTYPAYYQAITNLSGLTSPHDQALKVTEYLKSCFQI